MRLGGIPAWQQENRGNGNNKWYGNPPREKRFSKTHQTGRDAQIKALRKFHFHRNMIKALMNGKFHFPKNSKIEKDLCRVFGPEIRNSNAGMIMVAKQIYKAVEKAD